MEPVTVVGMDEDPVGRERHVVAARGADVEDGRHHGHLAARLEPHDLVIQDVRRGDRASGAVDPENHRAHPLVVLGLLELLADAREERDLRPALEGEHGLLREDPGEVDEQDLVGAAAVDGALLERPDARRQVDRHDAAARERQEGQREADETVAHDLAGRVYPPAAGRCRGCCDGSRPPRPVRLRPASARARRVQVSRPCERAAAAAQRRALKAPRAPGIVASPTSRRTHARAARRPSDRRPLPHRGGTARDPDPRGLRRGGDQGRAPAGRRRQPAVGPAPRARRPGVLLLRGQPGEAEHHDRSQASRGGRRWSWTSCVGATS